MKILVTDPLNPQLVSSGLGHLVIYRPDLSERSEAALRQTLVTEQPGALLTQRAALDPKTLAAWKEQRRRPVQVISRHTPANNLSDASSDVHSDIRDLRIAEHSLMRADTVDRLSCFGTSGATRKSLDDLRITLVGAGIVNLMTAHLLVESGALVEIVDAGPDPRSRPPWQHLGTTHGGENARMFCFTEADNYNRKGHAAGVSMREVLSKKITQGGWLAVPSESLNARENAWISRFLDLPRWRADVFAKDIHDFNIASGKLWEQFFQNEPELRQGVSYTSGVLRAYLRAEELEGATAFHARIGSLQRALDPMALRRLHPGLGEALDNGEIAGALEIRGFTLNIHDMVKKLLVLLERKGARCRWNQRILSIERDSSGLVNGLRTASETLRSEHYVISPGAYGHDLLEGTSSYGKVQGIVGLWALLPHLEPKHLRSIKIHREGHVGEDSNVTLSRDEQGNPILILGSGYGFIGERPLNMDSPEIGRLFEALEETAQRYFPSAYRKAMRDATLYGSRKACVRPFTSTGLGLFEVLPTDEGGRLIITAGHNTGGFTQSPVVAEAVHSTLCGIEHSMQSLYRPDREVPLPMAQEMRTPSPAILNAPTASNVSD